MFNFFSFPFLFFSFFLEKWGRFIAADQSNDSFIVISSFGLLLYAITCLAFGIVGVSDNDVCLTGCVLFFIVCLKYLFMLQEGRNALIDKRYRWKFPIPYILGDDLGESFFFSVVLVFTLTRTLHS